MFKKIILLIVTFLCLLSVVIGGNALEEVAIYTDIENSTVSFFVKQKSKNQQFEWSINDQPIQRSENKITLTLKEDQIINVKVKVKVNDEVVAKGELNNYSVNKAIDVKLEYQGDIISKKLAFNTWVNVSEAVKNSINYLGNHIFDYASIDGVKLDKLTVIENDTVILINSKEKEVVQHQVTIKFNNDVKVSDYKVKPYNSQKSIKGNNNLFLLADGDYVLEITDGIYKGFSKIFKVKKTEDINIALPALYNFNIQTKENSVVKKVLANTKQTVLSNNSQFIKWEITGLHLNDEELNRKQLEFIMPENDVSVKEVIKTSKGNKPSLADMNLSFDKASDLDLSFAFDWGSESFKAENITAVKINQKAVVYKVVGNNIVIDRNELLDLKAQDYEIRVGFDDIDATEAIVSLTILSDQVYNILVINGVASVNTAKENDVINLKADTIAGKKFKNWLSGDVVIDDIYNPGSSFKMVNKDIKVEAIYEDFKYVLSVNGISSDKLLNQPIQLKASKAGFKKWIIKGLNTSIDLYNKNLSFNMPANDVIITEEEGYRLNVRVNEKDSIITLIKDGKNVNVNDILEKGKYILKISKSGFKDYQQEINITDRNMEVSVNLVKSQNNLNNIKPVFSAQPKVKWTCADEGKVWDEGKKMCVNINVKNTNTSNVNKVNSFKIESEKMQTNTAKDTKKENTNIAQTTSTPSVDVSISPSSTSVATADVEVKQEESKKSGISWLLVATGVSGLVAVLGLGIFLARSFVFGDEE